MHRPDLPADQQLGIADACVCGKCKAEWLGWACPRSQARLDQESRFICDDERPGGGHDTWTKRCSLFGTFGVNFEVYVDDELTSDQISSVDSARSVAYLSRQMIWAVESSESVGHVTQSL